MQAGVQNFLGKNLPSAMFYEGTLQEGISTAVGQQKLVFCFVANENDESQTWENEYLRDESLKDVIAKRAVALRLTAGTEEAGYLAQIFPLPQTPTIVIMKHGELKEYIAAGTSKEEFFRRVQNSFDMPPSPSRSSASTTQPPASDALSSSPPTISAAPASTSSLAGVPPTIEQSDNVRRVLEQRAAKQEAAKQAAEKKATEDDSARQKLQTEKEAEARKSTQKQTELLKKKKQQEAEERRRILKRIQDDKDERRKQAQERELQRVGSQPRGDSPSSVANGACSPSTRPSSTRTGEYTSIQVRLFDGSTIRSRFKTTSAVKDVRKWVDEARTDGSVPYSFKQLLTPLPNRPIDDTEEDESMGEVGLSPSSTLILVPIRNYASAYGDSSPGVFSRVTGLILGVFTWLFGLLGLGGGSNDQPAPGQSANSMSAPAKNRRVQGFEKSNDGRRDHQLYNGNSLNFEPRPDEDEKK
ncbi:hypothetical protein C2857_002517 [Epichloe festucae Fl1]|uniref:UBX domain-containing protein 2 n=1 Tax=Epichloe festucae (strain Fl1) TaxID=877507 RepID=A0A7U3Q1T7_EPIFF|nr:hypothetical protein C2857_002517 [Epichloe festucae Fl1]